MKHIHKVAILGAGTMGARIAAHFANAGVPSRLLDILPPDAPPNGPARNKIAAAGLDGAIIHAQIDHDDLIRSIGDFDIGLALERPDDPNYGLTVTNKVFSYLLAGLPVAATSTPGQLELLERCPEISVCYPAGDSHALARALAPWVTNPAARREAQQAAWVAARRTFSWDRVSGRFLDLLSSSRPGRPAPGSEACVEF
jgi:glycosyltransferase involved in cell wall biosynthesis